MVDKVSNLDEHRPHVTCVDANGNAYVVPLSVIEDLANGKLSIKDDDDPRWIQAILRDWLSVNG